MPLTAAKQHALCAQIILPESLARIGYGAFIGCSSLKEITIPYGIRELTHHVFEGCSSLEKIVLPDSLCKAGIYVFKGCTRLRNVVISEGCYHRIRGDSVFDGTPFRQQREAQRKHEYQEARRQQGRCQHCGGTFTPILRECKDCKRRKDY